MRCFGIMLGLAVSAAAAPLPREADLCVYGGTVAGIAACLQAAETGRSAILLEPGLHLGGMTTRGPGAPDIGNKAAIGGLARDFYRRLGRHYGAEEAWKFEPSAAAEILREMIRLP